MALSDAFNLGNPQVRDTNVNFSWYGINGVTYQPLYSTNLFNWLPYGSPLVGTNGQIVLVLPADAAPQAFLRLQVSYLVPLSDKHLSRN